MIPEKIAFDELRHKSYMFGEILFIRALIKKQKELGIKDVREVAPNKPGENKMEVVLTVNGVQLPFFEVLSGLKESLGDMNKEKLEEWVTEKTSGIENLIYNFRKSMEEELGKMVAAKFNREALIEY